MYLHIFYSRTNYICLENRYVNDKIAHKLIIAALLFSLQSNHYWNIFIIYYIEEANNKGNFMKIYHAWIMMSTQKGCRKIQWTQNKTELNVQEILCIM